MRVREPKLEFHHPLVRSAVYHGAALTARQAAHRALAHVLAGEMDADRRAWHRAAASVEPDPSIVEELERAAQRARRCSGFGAASPAFERAAALSRDDTQRARQLTSAAENAWIAGRTERARMLLQRARPLASEPVQRSDIDRYLGLIELTGGVPADACRLLLGAAEGVAGLDAGRTLELLSIASVATVYAGDGDAAVRIAELARNLATDETPVARMLVQLLVGIGAFVERDFAGSAANLRSALALEEQHHDHAVAEQPVALLSAGRAAIFLGDDDAFSRIHHAAAARERADGALSLLAQILPRLGHAEVWAGRWGSAAATGMDGLRLARETGQHDLVAYQLALLALIAALRGDEEECRSLVADSRGLAAEHGFALVAEFAHWALVLLELGLGRHDDAFRHAEKITTTGAVFWAGLDRIDAAVRIGKVDTAREWLAAFEPWADSTGAAWARAIVLHFSALLADDDHETERLYHAALHTHAQAARPFERARTQLAFGEHLRRARRRVEAREHLRAALDGFETLGSGLWAERARVELRASGQTARRRDPSTTYQLTAQELQIAHFVAQGLSNREVAAQLFLSPRTVAFHLRNIFRKLGIASRTELARLDLDSARENTP